MPAIQCYNCRMGNPAHFVGTRDELKYYSVSNHGGESVNGKIFFCCESCFLDSVFIDAVVGQASKNHDLPDIRFTKNDVIRSDILGPIAEEMQAHYDEIVAPMYNEYSWNKFHERQKEFATMAPKTQK